MAGSRTLNHPGETSRGAGRSGGAGKFLFRLALLIGLAALGSTPLHAQSRRWAIPEGPGQWRTVEEHPFPRSMEREAPTTSAVTQTYLLNHITWNVTYLDPAGEGFNDAAKGADRRQAAVNAMATISNNLAYSTGTLDVIFNASSSAAADVLAFAGTPFPTGPEGFYNGMAFAHMATGADPSPALPDIYCTVNFTYPLFAGSGQPASTEYDLESILLHEFTHGLGLISLAEADGSSRISHTNPGVFSVWDSLLKTTTGSSLWAASGLFCGTPANLAGTPGVVFGGDFARLFNQDAYPPVYTPGKFMAGSSLSHWDPALAGTVMEPNLDPGEVKRRYSEIDRGALQDIGWRVYAITGVRGEWGMYE